VQAPPAQSRGPASENVVGVGNALPFAGAELSQTIDGLNDLRRLPAAPPLSNKWREPMMKHDWPTREQWAEQRRTVYFDMENPNPADKRP